MNKVIISFLTTFLTFSFISQANSDEVKIGVILGFTGPIESLTPTMAS